MTRNLPPHERRVMELVTQGHANKEIAFRLNLTVNTVKVYITRAYKEMNVNSRAEFLSQLLNAAHRRIQELELAGAGQAERKESHV